MRFKWICLGLVAASPAAAEPPVVVADIAPVHSLVSQVMGDLATPVLLLEANADPHHLSLRPSQARVLAEADAIFWIGPTLTPWLAKPVESLAETARSVALTEMPETRLIRTAADHDAHEDDHSYDGINPHAWLDPVNAMVWLASIARTLSELDPENRSTYEANAEAGAEDIRRLAEGIETQIAALSDARFLVTHDAFSYFGARFGLDLSDTVLSADAAPPSAARLARLRDDADGIRCAFREPQQSAAALETVLEGTAIPIAVLDPLGQQITPGPELYLEVLGDMAESIVRCSPETKP